MVYVKWMARLLLLMTVVGFFHYTLPQNDIVRIVNTDTRRVDFGGNSLFWAQSDIGQDQNRQDRDVRFIEAFFANDKTMVYRNEDTGWGWPPYFKISSANLQAQAVDLVSTKAEPQWVIIRHYGWRNELFSIYPNAVRLRAVNSSDVRIIPWLNIVILGTLATFGYAGWIRWRRFRRNRIEPTIEQLIDRWDAAAFGESGRRSFFQQLRAAIRSK